MDRSTLERKPVGDLREIASSLSLTGVGRLRKADLIDRIMGEVNAAEGDDGQSGDSADSADTTTSEDSAEGSGDDGSGDDGSNDEGSDDESDSDASDEASDDDASGDSDDGAESSGRRARDEVIERRRARARGGRPVAEREQRDEPVKVRQPERVADRDADRDTDRDGGRGRDAGRDAKRDDDKRGDDGDDANRNRNRSRNRSRGGNGGDDDLEIRSGVLDLLPEGYGFLRTSGYVSGPKDVYVSQSYVRRFNLRRGDLLGGPVRFNKGNDKFPALARLETCEGVQVSNEHDPLLRDRDLFEELTAVFPDERIHLESDGGPQAMRVLDLVAPIGKGQRGLVVAPRAGGSTTLVRMLAQAIEANAPDMHVMAVLVDERPEEVTDLQRSIEGEVIASTFDRPAEDHTAVAELAIERAKRLVERGHDVVVLLDSLTKLGHAYNMSVTSAGRTMAGGMDAGALQAPKRLFGAARNLEEGGSLTIIATALIDTGSEADAAILEEFKGAGNMEARLLTGNTPGGFPSVDVTRSGTRREELLRDMDELESVWKLRREWAEMEPSAALGSLLESLKATDDNAAFLAGLSS